MFHLALNPTPLPVLLGARKEPSVFHHFMTLYPNQEAAEHAKRVGELAYDFAAYLGWDEQRQLDCQMGGYLHDVGKRYIPDGILGKTSTLSESEYQIMKTHVYHAHDVKELQGLNAFVLSMIFEHHERLDGTGYPHGLKQGQCQLGGRLMAILDVYDAMTQRRCYQEARAVEEVLDYLMMQSGTLFDAGLVEHFVRFTLSRHHLHHHLA